MSSSLHLEKPAAKYQIISRKIEQEIRAGTYPIGHKLPPERKLAEKFDVSLLTMRQSLDRLEEGGLISRERGRGTFIRNLERIKIQKSRQNSSVGLIIVDNPEVEQIIRADNSAAYYQEQVKAIDFRLGDFNHNLVVSHTTVQDLINDRLPTPLEQEAVSGIILDGFIDASLVELFKKLDLPVVLLGNVLEHDPVPTVRCNVSRAGFLMTQSLINRSTGPVVFATEAFRLLYTRELFEGYFNACKQAGTDERLYTFTRSASCDDVAQLREMIVRFKDKNKPFSLLLNYNIGYELINLYREFGLDFADYPVVVFGAADFVEPVMQRRINVISGNAEIIARAAVDLLEDMIAGKPVESITVEPVIKTWEEDGEFRMDMEWGR